MVNNKVIPLNEYRIKREQEYLKQLKAKHQGKVATAEEIRAEMEIVSRIIGLKFPEGQEGYEDI